MKRALSLGLAAGLLFATAAQAQTTLTHRGRHGQSAATVSMTDPSVLPATTPGHAGHGKAAHGLLATPDLTKSGLEPGETLTVGGGVPGATKSAHGSQGALGGSSGMLGATGVKHSHRGGASF
jgi:hypothetical protein